MAARIRKLSHFRIVVDPEISNEHSRKRQEGKISRKVALLWMSGGLTIASIERRFIRTS